MNQIGEAFCKEYALLLEQQNFPVELRNELVPEACIGSSENGATYLFRQSDTGLRFVVKVRPAEQRYRTDIEESMLGRLQELGIPAPRLLKKIDTGDKIFLVREYVEGQTLEEYYRNREEWSEWETAEIGMAVCEQLEKLHNATPPIIHRDIKPQNIVITPDREVRLIDFDTARVYEEGKERDTFFFGTMQTASPEQYGFEQTDARTDIYGLGKTLIYLTCGCYDSAALEKTHCSSGFKRVIQKSISLLKDQRYRSAAELYRQLNKCRGAAMYRKQRLFGGALALILVAASVLGGVKYWHMRSEQAVRFKSQMLEIAVRNALNFDGEKEITYADLENVYELRVIGNTTFDASSKYYYQFDDCPDYVHNDKYKEKGDIADISLLADMPNLRKVYLCNQQIADISPLKDLQLTELALTGNYITDFTAISRMDSLRSLYIGGNPIQNIDFLEGNSTLRMLNIGNISVESLKPLAGTQIEELWVMRPSTKDGDCTVLSDMGQLCLLYTFDFSDEQLQSLNGCEHLQELFLWGSNGAYDLKYLTGVDNLHSLVLGDQFRSVSGIGNLKGLNRLVVGRNTVDLTALADSSSLHELDLYTDGVTAQDYTPVVEHPELRRIICNEEQMEALRRLNPDINTLELGTW